jgi:hypothetical protein
MVFSLVKRFLIPLASVGELPGLLATNAAVQTYPRGGPITHPLATRRELSIHSLAAGFSNDGACATGLKRGKGCRHLGE